MSEWWQVGYPGGPMVAVKGFPRPCYPPDAAPGKTPSVPGPDIEAYKRTVSRAGRWEWKAYDQVFNNLFSHGKPGGNVRDSGVAGVQRQQGITATGWVGKETFNTLRSIRIPEPLPHAGEPAMDARSVELINAAWDMFGGSEPDPEPPPTAAAVRLDRAVTQIGYKEDPPSSNRNKYGAWYGMDGVPWCFAGDTLVDTPRGMLPIDTILPGDRVMTASGRTAEVEAVARQRKPTIKVRAQGLDGTTTTKEHPYWARRRESARVFSEPEWIEAGSLRPGDMIAFPIPQEYGCLDDVTPEAAYVMGRWLADGYLVKSRRERGPGRVVITSSYSEAAGLQERLHRAGFPAHAQQAATCVQHELSGVRELASRLSRFGRGAHQKRIPGEVFMWTREARQALLAGYTDGDGHTTASGRTTITTVSRPLALGTAKLLRSLGEHPSVAKVARERTAVIQGRTVNQSDCYTVSWTPIADAPDRRQCFAEDGYLWCPVRSVTEQGEEFVYDLQVADEHTFVADGAAVHNCAIFVTWCDQTGGMPSFTFVRGVNYSYVPNIVAHARLGLNGLRVTSDPQPGDLACYDWSRDGEYDHVGLFEKWRVGTGEFTAVEGNTAVGNDSNGGSVMRRDRSTASANVLFVRVAEVAL